MDEKDNYALVPKPPGAIEKVQPGAKRILSSMVTETLALANKDSLASSAGKFRIGDYEWCEPDYQQILLWARSLKTEPDRVIKRLEEAHKNSMRHLLPLFHSGYYERPQESFQHGRLINVTLQDWDVDKFEWVAGLQLRELELGYKSWRPVIKPLPHKVEILSFPLPNLTCLSCGYISASEINLADLTNLKELHLEATVWQKLILPKTDALTSLSCSKYRKIDIGFFLRRFPRLRNLECGFNELETLELPSLPNLASLECNKNKLTRLNLFQNHQIINLSCPYNQISDLQLPHMPFLTSLNCSGNQLHTLQLDCLPNLTKLQCSDNKIEVLDIRQLRHLKSLTYDVGKTNLIQRADQHF